MAHYSGDIYQVPINGLLGGTTGHRIWEVKTVAQYTPGTRLVLEDGRVFRYAKASNIVTRTQFGVKFWNQIGDGIATTLSGARAAGDTTITIAAASGVAKDELVGGYVTIHTTSTQFRGIAGNTVAAAGANTVITLASPLAATVADGSYAEIYPNPYGNVYGHYGIGGHPAGACASVAGMPYVVTAVANSYIWIQTWGPIWINPYGDLGSDNDADQREVVFDHEGAIAYEYDAKGYTADSADQHQHAGFLINRQDDAGGAPLVMLQISP